MDEFTGMDLKGLGLFGECILRLIDSGKSEPLEDTFESIIHGNIVTSLVRKYDLHIMSTYDLDKLNAFFESRYPVAESSSCGIFEENSGFLLVLVIILNELEQRITSWK